MFDALRLQAKFLLLFLRILRPFAAYCLVSMYAADRTVYPVKGCVELAVNARKSFAIVRDSFSNRNNRILERCRSPVHRAPP